VARFFINKKGELSHSPAHPCDWCCSQDVSALFCLRGRLRWHRLLCCLFLYMGTREKWRMSQK